jgi:hypothetical protein
LIVHVHFASALPDDALHTRVRDGALDAQGLLVQLLQLLVVALLCVHLDLNRVHLQQLGALLQVLAAISSLTRPAAGITCPLKIMRVISTQQDKDMCR